MFLCIHTKEPTGSISLENLDNPGISKGNSFRAVKSNGFELNHVKNHGWNPEGIWEVSEFLGLMDFHATDCVDEWVLKLYSLFKVIYTDAICLSLLLLLLLSHFSRVRLCATPQTAAHQAPLSLGYARQEHRSGLPFPSPMRESEKWKWKVKVKLLSHVRLLATPWTAAYQAPPSMGFSRQEDWSGVPLPSLRYHCSHVWSDGRLLCYMPWLWLGKGKSKQVIYNKFTKTAVWPEKCIVSHFWRLEVWDQVLARSVPLKACEEDSVPGLTSDSGGFLILCAVLWHEDAPDLCLQLHMASPCGQVCVLISPFSKGISHVRLGAHPTPVWGFPGGSDSKESACNAGDPGSVSVSGRSLGVGNGYPLQYSWLGNPWREQSGGHDSDMTGWPTISFYSRWPCPN